MVTSFNFLDAIQDPDLYNDRFWQNFFPIPARNQVPIGSLAPTFELPDVTHGKSIRLADYRNDRPVVLAFTRIFTQKTVCPFCAPHIKALNDRYQEFVDRGAELLLIASLDPTESQQFVTTFDLKMPFLSDPTCEVFRQYGTGQALGAPLPAQFVLDRTGQVRDRHLFSFLEPNAAVDTLLQALS